MKTGLLLVNLGTPLSPEPAEVKKYLQEFLMDPHVIDIPAWKRAILVYGLIAPLRSRRSSKAYKKVWTEEGSPLLVFTERLTQKVRAELQNEMQVEFAMRYAEPSIPSVLDQMKDCDQIFAIPLYPQYADSSTGSTIDRIEEWKDAQGDQAPRIEILRDFPSWSGFTQAYIELYKETVGQNKVEHTLMSFHGLPERHIINEHPECAACLKEGGPCPVDYSERPRCYRAQCFDTARTLAEGLGIDKYSVSFQSRLGRDPWLTPVTEEELVRLAGEGKQDVAILCPAFVADCLETLEEIGIEARSVFKEAGGRELYRVPCPNDREDFAKALSDLAKAWMGGNLELPHLVI